MSKAQAGVLGDTLQASNNMAGVLPPNKYRFIPLRGLGARDSPRGEQRSV